MRKSEFILAALGLIVAILALIPAFGQWLFPREPIPVVNTPTPTVAAATATPPPIISPTASEVAPPPEASPMPTGASATSASPESLIAAECEAAQSASVQFPSSPIVAFYESNPQLRDDIQLVKALVVLSMQLAIQASADQDPRCLREIFAGIALGEVESTLASVRATGVVSVPWIEWNFSQLRDLQRVSAERIEASVCLYQGLNVYNQQGFLISTYPAEILAATYIFEQVHGGGRYYLTSILELDPFTYCQY